MDAPDLDALQIIDEPELNGGTMLLALGGWMDGGEVSTGTVDRLIHQQDARGVARIDGEGFYIHHLPGSMDVAALFRPHIEVNEGRLDRIEIPDNVFYADERTNLLCFVGQEPNLHWRAFADCLFALAESTGIRRIVFVGSYAGAVPHTREPRLYAAASRPNLLESLLAYHVRPADYEGPGSFSSYLLSRVDEEGLDMINLIAEIPAYIQGRNPLSIEAVTRRLSSFLGIKTDLDGLRSASDAWESEVSEAVAKDEELAEKIRQLEAAYDEDLLESGNPDDDAADED